MSEPFIIPDFQRYTSSKSHFMLTLIQLHDYFKDRDVRNAHVLSINNVGLGDSAVSLLKKGWNSLQRF